MSPVTVAFVGIGARGFTNLKNAYEIHEQEYFLRETASEVDRHDSENCQPVYHEHAAEVPDWAEDVSDLQMEVTAVFDTDADARDRAVSLCREHDDEPAVYEDWEVFLDADEYEAVVVSTPNYTHADVVIPLMEQGLNVFCEKPLATTLADHDRIIDADRETNGLFYVGFNARHSPAWQKIREIVHSGEIGDLGMLSVHEVRQPFPLGHYYTQEESGGSLLEKDCHDFDFFNYVVEADPVKVYALGGQQVLTENTDVNDHATVVYEYDNGVKATLELCLYAPFTQSHGRQLAVRGSEGVIRTPNGDPAFEVYSRDERRSVSLESHGSHGGSDINMWRDVLSCLVRGTERMASPTDAKKASAIAIGAEKAIEEDRVVRIDENYDLA